MIIKNNKVLTEVVKTFAKTLEPVELTPEQLNYFKCDNDALESELARRTSDYIFAQVCTFEDVDTGESIQKELYFVLMNRREYQVSLLFATPQLIKFLRNFFSIN